MSAALRMVVQDEGQPANGTKRSFFDAASTKWLIKVMPGEFSIARRQNEILVTVLGSCVAACIRDRDSGIGGMNHFMLPQCSSGQWGDDKQSTRFGNYAMEKLINELLKNGCRRESFEAKVFGGGNVTQSRNLVGTANADFVLRYLEAEGILCAAQDLGGALPRRVHYSPSTGRVVRRLLNSSDNGAVASVEHNYASNLSSGRGGGDIELFA